ncbi:MAG: hypothetical protein EOP04_17780 [Proteobacteria bacterium]|nr:MAG: hypothetical protein EOP04_17780 [Pseudomonadota bacterium]
MNRLNRPLVAEAIAPPAFQSEQWSQIFNTALISSRVEPSKASSTEIFTLMQEPAFQTLLSAIHQYAESKSIPESQAAQEVIQVFRRIDHLWTEVLLQEGFERLQGR